MRLQNSVFSISFFAQVIPSGEEYFPRCSSINEVAAAAEMLIAKRAKLQLVHRVRG